MQARCTCLRQALLWHCPKQQVSRPAAALSTSAEYTVSVKCIARLQCPNGREQAVAAVHCLSSLPPALEPVSSFAHFPACKAPPACMASALSTSTLTLDVGACETAPAPLLRAVIAGRGHRWLRAALACGGGAACGQNAAAAPRGCGGAVRRPGLHVGGRAGSCQQGRGGGGSHVSTDTGESDACTICAEGLQSAGAACMHTRLSPPGQAAQPELCKRKQGAHRSGGGTS